MRTPFDEVFRDQIQGPDGDKISVSVVRRDGRSVVSISAQRGGYGMTFCVPVGIARDMASTLNAAADAAEKRKE
jgi:hypothetical protein